MGRPREFDPGAALDSAMKVFWMQGFEATSMQDLMAATGLHKQSLYGAFGNKLEIYVAALRRYEATHLKQSAEILAAPGSAQDRVAKLFQAAIERACRDGDRSGCLLCNAAVDRAPLCPDTQSAVAACVAGLERAIAGAIARAAPYDGNPALRARRARAVLAAYFGLNVLAKAGAGKAALEDVRDSTLDAI